jgi:chemotaxis methyl-accepting protein methylase
MKRALLGFLPMLLWGCGEDNTYVPPPPPTVSVSQPYVRQPVPAIEAPKAHDQLSTLLALVRSQTRQDFRAYKKQTLLRQIHRRMGLHRIENLSAYLERLHSDPEEVAALTRDFTINVTGFFRDPEAWQVLDQEVIAPLVQQRLSNSSLRIWVAGCSTGEEAYSIAMLVGERSEAAKKTFDLKIFATDVAQGVLPAARAGLYPSSIAADVGAERLARFFHMEDDSYCVRKMLRETVTFAPQNLLRDPPFSRLDLISCRNLLIYLKPDVQERVLALFHFALREGGHLFLGPAETTGDREDLFQPVSKKWRIYRRVGPTSHDVVDNPLIGPREVSADAEAAPEAANRQSRGRSPGSLMERALLERYAPASALIDRQFKVLYLHGATGDYLQPPRGEPSFNLIAMAREGLQTTLGATVRKAIEKGHEVRADSRVRRGDSLHPVRMTVAPLSSTHAGEVRLLVSFFERDLQAEPGAPAKAEVIPAGGELQVELDAAREDLRITIEQMETANEELQASNEETRSINEELQASNEELETSKEELQSLNEELNTVNAQLQVKVAELEVRTNDLNNLLKSTEIATLFLDPNLCIRWFTPAMKSLLELLPTDIGRPVSHFAQKFRGDDLVEGVKGVLATLSRRESEVVSDEGRWYVRQVVPYRTDDDRIDGVVVTFVDITELKRRENELQAAKLFAESIVDTVREPLLVLTSDLKVRSANDSFYRDFQVTPEETENRLVYELGNRQWDIPALRRLLEEVLPTDKQFSDFGVEHEFDQIGFRSMLLNARRIDDVQLILLAIEDVTERKRGETAARPS